MSDTKTFYIVVRLIEVVTRGLCFLNIYNQDQQIVTNMESMKGSTHYSNAAITIDIISDKKIIV